MHSKTLEEAITSQDLAEARKRLSEGVDPNAETENCHLPLFLAAWTGNAELVQLLLSSGASPTQRDQRFQMTALHHAKSRAVASVLLAAGLDVNALSDEGRTPLQSAASEGDASLVKLLLEHGADVNPNSHPFSPLHAAVARGKTKVAQTLLAAGADSEAADSLGFTPLMTAACRRKKQSLELVKMLLSAGANANAQQYPDSGALLWHAAGEGTADTVQVALAGGASIDWKNKYGETALTHAIYEGRADTAAALLAGGADPDCRIADNHPDDGRRGKSARDLAAASRKKQIQALFSQR